MRRRVPRRRRIPTSRCRRIRMIVETQGVDCRSAGAVTVRLRREKSSSWSEREVRGERE